MRKGIKILGKVFSAAVLLLIIVPVALSLLLDIPAVQNYAVHRAARFVSRKLETTVSIDRVDIGIFSKVRVKGFYVEDYQRDTLLYVGKLDAFITSFGIFGGGLELSRGEIADARLYLRQTPGGEMNIKQIVDRISDPDKPKKGNFRSRTWTSASNGSTIAIRSTASTSRTCTSTASRPAWTISRSTGRPFTPPLRPFRPANAAASC